MTDWYAALIMDVIQCRLLGETPPLTFKKAIGISQGMEMAANKAKDIQKGNGGMQMATVHQVRKEAGKEIGKHAKWVECFQCGGTHYANVCKFRQYLPCL